MSRNLRGRLAKLEKEKGPDNPTFPFWEMMAGLIDLEDWLAAHGYADPLAALRAGVRGPGAASGLVPVALDWWLQDRGYSEPWQAWEAGESAPAELEHELIHRAASGLSGKVFAALQAALRENDSGCEALMQCRLSFQAMTDAKQELAKVWAEIPEEVREQIRRAE
jgi:hypothetical protein